MADELEHDVKTVPIDEALPGRIETWKAEGWELIPGVVPVAVYHVVRRKASEATDAKVRMVIDESKVLVVRNGSIVE